MAEPITLPRGIRDYLDGLTAEQVERVLSEPIERWGHGLAGHDDPHAIDAHRWCMIDISRGARHAWGNDGDASVMLAYDRLCVSKGLSVVVTAIKDYLRARHVN